MKTHELDPWVMNYLDYERNVKRLNHRSIADKRCTLKKAAYYMSRHCAGVPLWKASLENYLTFLNEGREEGRSESALAKDISHIRGLLNFAWSSGRADRNVLDGFSLQDRVRKKAPEALSLNEAARLVEAYDKGDKSSRRARLVVLILYGCGLRPFELCRLNVPDVDIERQELFVRSGKGDKQRRVPIPGAVWAELTGYMLERGWKRGPLFRTEIKMRRIAVRGVAAIIKEARIKASIDWNVTPKTLRHTFATHLMDRGVDVGVIASLMGHSTPNETGVYLHVVPGRKEAAVQELEEGGIN